MRVAIIGSRDLELNNESDLLNYLPSDIDEIVSGGAEGADQIAELIARLLSVPIKVFRPEYKYFQKLAPLVRNQEIIAHADCAVALWDGSSRGTAHAIKCCIQSYKPIKVLLCRDGEILRTMSDIDIRDTVL